MNGNTLIGGGAVSPNPGPSWKAIGTGDFNGDGLSDILWQNTSSGQVSIWEMNGNSLIGGGPVTAQSRAGLESGGTGDFNGDGHSDILFQNTTSSGQVSIWEMNGNTLIGGGPVSPNPGPSWKAIGTGDFNDDGRSDILFQNTTSGQVSIWEMNGNTLNGRRTGQPQSRAELACDRNRRFQRRRSFRHPVSKRERPSLDLGNEREQPGRRRARQPQSRAELASSRVT